MEDAPEAKSQHVAIISESPESDSDRERRESLIAGDRDMEESMLNMLQELRNEACEEKPRDFGEVHNDYPTCEENTTCEYLDNCLLYTSPSPRDRTRSRMPSSA